MSPSTEDAELIQRLMPTAKKIHQLMVNLLRQRKKLQQLLTYTDGQLKHLARMPDDGGFRGTFMRLQKQSVELGLKQLEAFTLEGTVLQWAPLTGTPLYKMRDLYLELLTLQMERLVWQAFVADLNADLAALAEGQDPDANLPPIWLELRKALPNSPTQIEAWQQFTVEVGNFSTALDAFLDACAQIPDTASDAEQFAAWEGFKLPVLKGVRYRAQSYARRVPKGEDLLKSLTQHYVPNNATTEPAPRALTNRLKNLFKPGT
jgi:hypothetical protein